MNVLGLDLSITATGIARPDGSTLTVNLAASLRDGRLSVLDERITDELDHVDLAVIEDLPTHAHGAGITGMVHGIARLALLQHQVPYVLVPPATLKKYATARGNANKADMRMELYKRVGLDLTDDNQVDAWWLRAMGLDHFALAPVVLPATHRGALAKVGWPTGSRAA